MMGYIRLYNLVFATAIFKIALHQSTIEFSLPNKRIGLNILPYLDRLHASTLTACVKECLYLKRCKAFAYTKSTNYCFLTEHKPSIQPPMPNSDDDFVFEITDWPKVIAGSCSNEPCSEMEKCIPSRPPSCIGFCGAPFDGGKVSKSVFYHGCYIKGCVIRWDCEAGFSSTANDTITSTCQANGTWSTYKSYTCIAN